MSAPVLPSPPVPGETSGPDPRETVRDDLIWLLARLLEAAVASGSEALAPVGVSLRAFQVLSAAIGGCSTNQLTMARRLGVDRSVMVGLVDELEHAGLVERKPDPTDRRSRIITPTAAGRERVGDLQQRLLGARADVLGALDPQEQAAFVAMLQRVVDTALDRGLAQAEGTCPGVAVPGC